MGKFDTSFKELVSRQLADLLPWLLPDCGQARFSVQPCTLPATAREVDLLLKVTQGRGPDRQRSLKIFECQCQHDPDLPPALLLRAALAHCCYGMPVTTILLAFTRAAAIPPAYVYGSSDRGKLIHRVVVRHVYAEPAEEALSLRLPALLPLIPTMVPQDGDRAALLQRTLEEIAQLPVGPERKRQLMRWATTFANLHLKRARIQNIVESVKRRNRSMLHPFDFPMLREEFEEGERKARQAAARKLQKTAIEICRKRFGQNPAAEARIRKFQSIDRLSRLLVSLSTSASLKEALPTHRR